MKLEITRLAISTAAGLLSAMAAAGYSHIAANDASYRQLELPPSTAIMSHAAIWVPLLPLTLFVVGLVLIRKSQETAVTVIRDICWMFAICWPTIVVVVWKLPYMLIGERIGGF